MKKSHKEMKMINHLSKSEDVTEYKRLFVEILDNMILIVKE